MAGQVWLLLAVCGLVAVARCHASAEAQLLYNIDGTPRLEVINTGVPGQSQQGRFSWQTPKGTLVWVQYPINHQGYVPWTPAEYSYSVSSYPTKKVYPVIPQDTRHPQIPTPRPFVLSEVDTIDTRRTITNNNAQPYIQIDDEPSNRGVARSPPTFRFDRRIDYHIPNNVQTIHTTTEKTVRTTPERRRFTVPFTTTSQRPLSSITLSTTTTEDSEYTNIITESPVEDVISTARPFVVSEIETTEIRKPIVLSEVETTDIRKYAEYTSESPVEDVVSTARPFVVSEIESTEIRKPIVFSELETTDIRKYAEYTSESPVDLFTVNSFEDYAPTARPSVVDTYTVKTVEDALPTPRQITNSEIETADLLVDDRLVVHSNDKEVIPATESVYENNFYDETDIHNVISEAKEQVEDTTELGPVVRYTSRGRKALFYESPQKLTNTHSIEENSNNSPVSQPRLIEDLYLGQINAAQPPTTANTKKILKLIEDPSLRQSRLPTYRVNIENRPVEVNTENRNRSIRRRLRKQSVIRRKPVTENNIVILNNQSDEDSNRGSVRRLSLSARLRNHHVRRT